KIQHPIHHQLDPFHHPMNPQHCITQGAVDIKSQLTRQCLHGCQVLTDRSHALRGNAASDALRPALRKGDAERHRMHSHAERGNDQLAVAADTS
ncbi:hypothetical protein EUX58_19425, partial [Pseudomonas sp. 770NI]